MLVHGFRELGFNCEVMKYTKIFNAKLENGKYKTIAKAYLDFDIIIFSVSPLSIEEVKNIMEAHITAQSWVCRGYIVEGGATYEEFLKALEELKFSQKIESYEYQNGGLVIEVQ